MKVSCLLMKVFKSTTKAHLEGTAIGMHVLRLEVEYEMNVFLSFFFLSIIRGEQF